MIRFGNPWRGRPMVDVHRTVEHLYVHVAPMDFTAILANPVTLHPLATDAATGRATDLRPYLHGPAELRLALRASAALPLLAGPPVELGGRRWFDAGLAESVPFRTAIAQDATHVLVLRSRRAPEAATSPSDIGGPSRGSRLVAATVLRRYPLALRETYLARAERLAADDALLDGGLRDGAPLDDGRLAESGPALLSVRPAPDAPHVGRLARDGAALLAGFEAGHAAMTATFGGYSGRSGMK